MKVEELITPRHCADCQGEPEGDSPTFRFDESEEQEYCPRHLALRYADTLARLRLCELSRKGAMRHRELLLAAAENARQGLTNLVELHALPNSGWEEAATLLRDQLQAAIEYPLAEKGGTQ